MARAWIGLSVAALMGCTFALAQPMPDRMRAEDAEFWKALTAAMQAGGDTTLPEWYKDIQVRVEDPVLWAWLLCTATVAGADQARLFETTDRAMSRAEVEAFLKLREQHVATSLGEVSELYASASDRPGPTGKEADARGYLALFGALTVAMSAGPALVQLPPDLSHTSRIVEGPEGAGKLLWETRLPAGLLNEAQGFGAQARASFDLFLKMLRDVRAASAPVLAQLSPEHRKAVEGLFDEAQARVAKGLPQPEDTPEGPSVLLASVVSVHAAPDGALTGLEVKECWPLMVGTLLKAREKAQQEACLSNLKQLGLAAMMYVQDHEEQFPAADDWSAALRPYILNEQLLRCPGDEGAPGGLSYFFNSQLSKLRFDQVQHPADIILMAEGQGGSGGPERLTGRHFGKVNCVFADGHAKLMKLEEAQRPEYWRPH